MTRVIELMPDCDYSVLTVEPDEQITRVEQVYRSTGTAGINVRIVRVSIEPKEEER